MFPVDCHVTLQVPVQLLDCDIVACKDSCDLFHLLESDQNVVCALEHKLVDPHIAESTVEAAEELLTLLQNVLRQHHQSVAQFEHLLPLVFSLRLALLEGHYDLATVSIDLLPGLLYFEELI